MVVSIACDLVSRSPPEDPSNNTDNSEHSKHDVELVEDWSEYGDYEVWVAARKMLQSLSQEDSKKIAQRGNPVYSQALVANDGNPENAGFDTKDAEANRPLVKGGEHGLILETPLAELLLKKRAYFVHSHSVYCYDENRLIFRVEGQRYHRVTNMVPNPPGLQIAFDIGGMTYRFDECGALWYAADEEWLLVTIQYGPNFTLSS